MTNVSDERLAEMPARVKELEKTLERIKAIVTYPCDTSIQVRGYGILSIDASGCEYIAELIDIALAKRPLLDGSMSKTCSAPAPCSLARSGS